MIEKSLQKLGLKGHEATIYSTLLSNSPAGASLIAKKCSLSRSSVYTTLSTLIAKGLVGTTYKNEIKQFTVQDFTSLRQLIEKEKRTVNKKFQILDRLENDIASLVKKNLNIPQIVFFEGQEGLKKIYLSMLRQANKNDTMYILRDEFVWQSNWQFIFEKDWRNLVDWLKQEKKIKTAILINDSPEERAKQNFYKSRKDLKFRFLPKNLKVKQFVIYILSDIVSILSMENTNLVGIKITNQHMAKNFRIMFDSFWIQSTGKKKKS